MLACRTLEIPINITAKPPEEFPKTEGEPSKKAILQIETGMHNSEIAKVAIDENSNFLVTGAKDKTVRIWNLQNGELINILRPPVGKNREGEIYAVALSPDGRYIACGGWTGDEWDHTFSIYIFERESAKMVGLIAGIPAAVNHLTFSSNGEYLAASLAQGSGMRVYQMDQKGSYSLVAMDKDYASDSYWLDFDKTNRIVTTSYDGFIRLYDSSFRLVQKSPGKSGKKPNAVHFSPNGEQIAVAYNDADKIDLFSGEKGLFFKSYLAYESSYGGKDIKKGMLRLVNFSQDGKFLFAGGSLVAKDKSFVRRWKVSDGGENAQDYPSKMPRLNDIIPLPSQGLLTIGSSPAFELITSEKKTVFFRQSPVYEFSTLDNQFYTDRDGKVVRVKKSPESEKYVEFSLPNRRYKIIQNDNRRLHRPLTAAFGVVIKDWQGKSSFSLNNKTITLSPGEAIQSYTISPNEKLILLGTENSLYLVDITGKIVWKTIIAKTVWSVLFSQNMKKALVTLSDGTVRWYRVSDGKELVALFLHTDGEHWLLYTPQGLYDTNDKNGEMLGWTINQARKNAALYLPGYALKSSFRRPEIIQKLILSNKTDTEILQSLESTQPDVPEFMSALYESIVLPEENKTLDSGKTAVPVAKVFSTNPVDREIIIAYKKSDKLFKPFDRLFVYDEKERIYLKVKYAMHSMTKCALELDEANVFNKVKLNSTVYLESSL